MSLSPPVLLALDFDGVLCDGLIEYFQTAWRVYCRLWSPANLLPPDGLATTFYQLRPVVETGWEMPLVIRAVQLGIPVGEILHDWPAIAQRLLVDEHVDAKQLSVAVDGLRDEWLTADLSGWLSLHRFYPGVVERLRSLLTTPVYVAIISTKEGRFIDQLLQQQGLEFPTAQIFGKEVQQPKHQVIRQLAIDHQCPSDGTGVWFVEDRLKTLQGFQKQPDLEKVRLYLADWGYNTVSDRESVQAGDRIQRLSLSQFTQEFSAW